MSLKERIRQEILRKRLEERGLDDLELQRGGGSEGGEESDYAARLAGERAKPYYAEEQARRGVANPPMGSAKPSQRLYGKSGGMLQLPPQQIDIQPENMELDPLEVEIGRREGDYPQMPQPEDQSALARGGGGIRDMVAKMIMASQRPDLTGMGPEPRDLPDMTGMAPEPRENVLPEQDFTDPEMTAEDPVIKQDPQRELVRRLGKTKRQGASVVDPGAQILPTEEDPDFDFSGTPVKQAVTEALSRKYAPRAPRVEAERARVRQKFLDERQVTADEPVIKARSLPDLTGGADANFMPAKTPRPRWQGPDLTGMEPERPDLTGLGPATEENATFMPDPGDSSLAQDNGPLDTIDRANVPEAEALKTDEVPAAQEQAQPDAGPTPADPRENKWSESEMPQVEDRSKWAALQGVVENAWRMGGQSAPKGGYYAQKLKQGDEQAAQVKEYLKQKFQHGENELNRDVQRQHNQETAAATKAWRATQDENSDLRRQQSGVNAQTVAGGLAGRHIDTETDKALKDMPDPYEVDAYNRLMKRMNDPTPFAGLVGGNTARSALDWIPLVGENLGEKAASAIQSGDTQQAMQDALIVGNGLQLKYTGKAMTPDEARKFRAMIGSSKDDATFRRGVLNALEGVKKKAEMDLRARPPEVQNRLREAGAVPSFVKPDFGFTQGTPNKPIQQAPPRPAPQQAPPIPTDIPVREPPRSRFDKAMLPEPRSSNEPSDLVHEYLSQKYGQVPEDWANNKGLYLKKMQEDPKWRIRIRDENGIA